MSVDTKTVIAQLDRLIEWFDNPNTSAPIVTRVASARYTPGYLLRVIRDALVAATNSVPDSSSVVGETHNAGYEIEGTSPFVDYYVPGGYTVPAIPAPEGGEATDTDAACPAGMGTDRDSKQSARCGAATTPRQAGGTKGTGSALPANEASDLSAGASHPDEAALRAAIDSIADPEVVASAWWPRICGRILDVVRPFLRFRPTVVTEAQVREALERHGWYIPPGLLFGPYADVVAALRDLGLIGGEK